MSSKDKFTKYLLIVSFVVLVIAGLFYLGITYLKKKTVSERYTLTHTQGDAEYLLSWDVIGARCPGVDRFEKQDQFVRRGETISFGSGQSSLPKDSLQAWTSSRWAATPSPSQGQFHSLLVGVSFFDSDGSAEEYLKRIARELGIEVQEEEAFTTAMHETLGPAKSRKAFLAGNHLLVTLDEIASSGEKFFCAIEDLRQIVSSAQKKIWSLEITSLPPQIPSREEKTPLEWSEIRTIRSEDVLPYKTVPEGESYNEQWFEVRPLEQSFAFASEQAWRIVMTMTGEVGTKAELRWTIKRPEEPDISASEVFQLSSEQETHIRPDPHFQPSGTLAAGDVQIEILAERPLRWVVKIEVLHQGREQRIID